MSEHPHRRRHGRLQPLTLKDRVRKAARNDRRGRAPANVRTVHEPRIGRVGSVPLGTKANRGLEQLAERLFRSAR